ncbi:MAG: PD-(D/E)XK nuclease family protein [Tunicatimonas sp.]
MLCFVLYLGHLLNPGASHEQGALFLDSFFRNVLNLPFSHDTVSYYKIREELATASLGRLDIFMSFIYDGRPKAIVIENKIYAADQEQQLTRYHRYLTSVLNLSPEDYWLFYLTPQGTSPSTNAIDPESAKQLQQDQCLFNISYRQHITNWLNDCYPRVSSPRVQHALYQYLTILPTL